MLGSANAECATRNTLLERRRVGARVGGAKEAPSMRAHMCIHQINTRYAGNL